MKNIAYLFNKEVFIQRQVAAETLLHWADGEREVYLKGLSNRPVMFYRLFGKMAYRSAWRVTNFLYNEENSFIYGLTKNLLTNICWENE